MDSWAEALSVASVAANVWFLTKLPRRGTFTQEFVFIVHLTVFDLLHDFHAALYLPASKGFISTTESISSSNNSSSNGSNSLSWAQQQQLPTGVSPPLHHDSASPYFWWLCLNQFLGFCLSLAPLLAVLVVVAKRLFRMGQRGRERRRQHGGEEEGEDENVDDTQTWSNFKRSVRRQQALLWTAAALAAAPIVFFGRNFVHFGIASDYSHSSNYGIVSHLPSSSSSSGGGGDPFLRLYLLSFECSSNPLWFPLACLLLVPMATFLALRKEASAAEDKGKGVEARDDSPEEPFSSSPGTKRQKPPWPSSTRLLACVFLLYYAVFVFDLLSYGGDVMRGKFGEDSFPGRGGVLSSGANLQFTHSELRGPALVCVLCFREWTRPAAAVARNAVVAVAWGAARRRRVVNV